MQSVLVTGGNGFIGSNLIRKLLEKKVKIHAIVRPESDLFRIKNFLPHIFLHKIDLENFSVLQKTMREIDPKAIFHLAAYGVLSKHNDLLKILTSNVIGTFNLLLATKNLNYTSFIHAGGSSEYGKKESPMSEKNTLQPATLYGVSKASSSLLAMQFAFEHQKPIAVVRPFSVYGPFESSHRLIPKAFDAALNEKKIFLTKPGFARDYIYVEDVVDAIVLCWENKISNEILNIGTGIQTTNEKVVKLIEEITEKKIDIQIGAFPPRLSDTSNWVSDNTKIKKMLHWKPKYSLRKGLEKTFATLCQSQISV